MGLIHEQLEIEGKGKTRKVYCKHCKELLKSGAVEIWGQHMRTCKKPAQKLKSCCLCLKKKQRQLS